MALTYFFANTVPIAIAIALTTNQSAWKVWKTDFVSSARQLFPRRGRRRRRDRGDQSAGIGLTLLLAAAPLYLTYKVYRAGRRNRGAAGRDSRSGARRDHHDGSAAEHPGIQSGGGGDVRPQADEHPRPATSSCCCPSASGTRSDRRSSSTRPAAADRWPGGSSNCTACAPTAASSRSS